MKKAEKSIKIKRITAAFLALVMICLSGADALPGGAARHAAAAETAGAAAPADAVSGTNAAETPVDAAAETAGMATPTDLQPEERTEAADPNAGSAGADTTEGAEPEAEAAGTLTNEMPAVPESVTEQQDSAPDAADSAAVMLNSAPAMHAAAPALMQSAQAMLAAAPAAEEDQEAGAVSMLQSMVNKAMAAKDVLSGRLQVILSRNVTYEGDAELTAGARDVAPDFELEISAEDAGGNGMQGDGYTSIQGNILIRGIKVILNSILMGQGSVISVLNAGPEAKEADQARGGELVFNALENGKNEVTVEVGDQSSATINMADADDTVQLTMLSGAKQATVSTGDGINTVNATVSGGDLTLSGAGSNRFSVTTETGAGRVEVNAGAGKDTVNLTDNGAKAIEVSTGAGDDTINVDVRADAADATIDTGAGQDTLTFSKGDHHTAENLDYSRVYNMTEKINDASTAEITVINGDEKAVDRATVDIDVADAIRGIRFRDGAGVSVHLKGTLAAAEEGGNAIRFKDGDANTIILTHDTNGSRKNTVEITGGADTNYTDALKNKKQVYLYADGDSYTFTGAAEDFTDYVFKTPVSGLQNIVITGSEKPLTLSNVVLGSDDSRDEDDNITVHNLSAPELNVLLKGRVIDISGKVTARNLRAESVHGTETVGQLFTSPLGAGPADQTVNFFNIADSSVINVNDGADIQTAQDIQLLSRVKHFGALSSLLGAIPGLSTLLNAANIKVADAQINIRSGAKLNAGGTVAAESKIETVTGYNRTFHPDGSVTENTGSTPLAVTVVVNDASVQVEQGAEITAKNDILLKADSQVKAKTFANAAMIPSPVEIAFALISNDVKVQANGRLTAGNKVSLTASGSVTDEAKADRNAAGSAVGGFVAVNIVDQDVQAVVGEGADIRAGGALSVMTNATANVKTGAVASAQPSEGGMTPGGAFKQLVKSIGGAVVSAWRDLRRGGNSDTEDPDQAEIQQMTKLEKLMNKVAGSGYSLKLIGYSEENDAKGSAAVSTKIRTRQDDAGKDSTGKAVGFVEVLPESGVEVKEVRYRYLEPNSSRYTYGTAKYDPAASSEGDGGSVYVFDMPEHDVEVFVIYRGEPDQYAEKRNIEKKTEIEGYEDVYDLSALFGEAVSGAEEEADEPEYLTAKAEGIRYRLAFGTQNTDGKVLTWQTSAEPNREGYSIEEIHAGEKVRFIGNPAQEHQSLVSLTFTWTVAKDGAEVTERKTVTADSAGRFYFTAPENLPEGTEITVSAEFGTDAEQARGSTYQVTGAIAAGVVLNDARGEIEPLTNVEAGSVSILSMKGTSSETLADGSAVEKAGEKQQGKASEAQEIQTEYSVTGAWYAVQVSSTKEGAVESTMAHSDGSSALHPKFTVKKEYADQVEKVILSYYTNVGLNLFSGTRVTREISASKLTRDGSGNLVYQPELNDNPVVYGSTLEVSFIFREDGEALSSGTTGSTDYLVPNPINLRYNQLAVTEEDGSLTHRSMGTLNFAYHPDDDPGKYYFTVIPAKGYRIDAMTSSAGAVIPSDTEALFASWRGADGAVHKAPLFFAGNSAATGGETWYLDLDYGSMAIPKGAQITVNALFTEDTRGVEVRSADHGSAVLDTDAAKAGDTITATLTAKDGYVASGAEITYVDKDGNSQTRTVSGVSEKGEIGLEMPELSRSATLYIKPLFTQKNVTLNVTSVSRDGAGAGKADVVLSEKGKGYGLEKITVSPSDQLAKQGYKVAEVSYNAANSTGGTVAGNSFTIPENATSVSLQVRLALKDFALSGYTDPEGLGSIEPVYGRADRGEKVAVRILPKDGYRIRTETLKARITDGKNSYQIVMRREGENSYSFTMPGDLGSDPRIELEGSFEKGSDALAVSAGVAVAVGVTQGSNTAAISGGTVRAEKGISLTALGMGNKAATEAKAGFSQGKTGVAGAVSVQVARIDTAAVIRADGKGSVTIGDGALSLNATNKMTSYAVNADASGKKKQNSAEKTGVGAGIAVAVDAVSTEATVEDGVRLRAGTLRSVSLTAVQRIRDSVTAASGAAGGSTAVVPVAAVDVFEAYAKAELGRLSLAAGDTLDVKGNVKLKAGSDSARAAYNHTVTADASATGGSTALAGAFAVSWLNNDAEAILNQSVDAEQVIVSAQATDALKSKASAAASGGDKGKKDGKGGSADKQANSLLGGAAGIANQNGMSGARIKQDAAHRQLAETAEGSVAGAGALALNVMRNRSLAEVKDGVHIRAKDLLSVTSANRTDGTIKADGSTVRSDTGVGVAVSVNIVTMDNIARIGSGTVTAGRLDVLAAIPAAAPLTRTVTVAENAAGFKTQLGETLKQSITEWLGDDMEWAADLVGDDFIATFADSLIRDLGLEKLFNISSDGVEDTFSKLTEKLKSFPQTLAEPYRLVLGEFLESAEGMDGDKILRILEDAVTEAGIQMTTMALPIIKEAVLDGAKDLATGFMLMLSDGIGGKGWNTDGMKDRFKGVVVERVKEQFVNQFITELVSKLGAEIPLINQNSIQVVKALKEKTGEQLRGAFLEDFTRTFRQTVYDYEIIGTKIREQGGIKNFLAEALKKAAKKATSAVANAAIEKALGQLDVRYAPEPVADRHVITTQSIAGAGADDVGVAGSVSVAVANLTTEAKIAAGAGAVTVENDGALTVNAEELRRIRTHATAAVTGNGEADNNLGAGETEDAGGSADAGATETHDGISVSTDGRGTASFSLDEPDPMFGDIEVRLYPEDGYTLKEGATLVRHYIDDEDDDGEIVDSVKIHKDNRGFFIRPMEGIEDATERYWKLKTSIVVEFEPVQEEKAAAEDIREDGTSVGVGAAFALSYGDSAVTAEIGSRPLVTAGSAAVTAAVSHEEENYATAGTDPFEGTKGDDEQEGVKDFSLDASVSISMIDNRVTAAIAEGTKVVTTGIPGEADREAEAEQADGEDEEEPEIRREKVTGGALIVTAYETGEGETKASAFAAGEDTAVGASVAVNIAKSEIRALLGAGAQTTGKAVIWADSHSEDNTWSFASAMGGDIQRMLNKAANGIASAQDSVNSLARGEYFDAKAKDDKEKENATDTSKRVTGRLNEQKAADGDAASENLSVSANVLRTQGARQDEGKEADDASAGAESSIAEYADQKLTGAASPGESKKLQVAAAVGVTVTDHRAAVTVGGPVSAGGDIEMSAVNTVNFNTRSTGAAMSLASGNSIAAAVGVSVNRSEATVDVNGNVSAKGDADITATLTQNMDGEFAGRLGVQSLSGAVTGKDSTLAIAGAVSVLVTNAVTRAAAEGMETISGGSVTISADDKSKNAVRAGGISVSKGASVGMGLSSATIVSENHVDARVGDGVTVTAKDFTLSALKREVTFEDYKFPLGWDDLVSDTSELTDEQRENVYTGLIDVHKKPGETAYTIDVNLDTYALMKLPDMLNFLSSNNYYAEAIAGSASLGSGSKLNAAGSVAVVKAKNIVNAGLGRNVTITQTGADGGVSILADGSTSARIIGGAASLGSAKAGVGLTVTFLDDEDAVTASAGDGLKVQAEDYSQQALANTTAQTFNAAAAVNTGSDAAGTVGGAVNVLLLKNSAESDLGADADVHSGGNIEITSAAEMQLLNVSVGVAGAGKGVAAGGTVAYIQDDASSETNLEDRHTLTAADSVTVSAATVDRMISVLASASAALSSSAAGAGAINVLNSGAAGIVNIRGEAGTIQAAEGDVTILGEARSKAVNITAAAAGSGSTAIGASANVNVFSREAKVNIEGSSHTVTAGRDVRINAYGEDSTVLGGLAFAGSTGGNAVSGNILVLVEDSETQVNVRKAAQVTAGNAAQIEAYLDESLVTAGGSIALSASSNSVGATVLTVVKSNDVRAVLGTSTVTAAGSAAAETLSGEKAKGIYIGANAAETDFLLGAGVAAAGGWTVNGIADVLVNSNTVIADASAATLKGVREDTETEETRELAYTDVTVRASDDTRQIVLAGGLNVSGSTGVGASVVTLVSNKEVRALGHDMRGASVRVAAENRDDITQVAVSVGLSGSVSVQVGAAVQVLKSKAIAEVGSTVTATEGSVTIEADNHTSLVNAAGALAGSGSAAVTPVGAVTYFSGETRALLKSGSVVNAAKDVTIRAGADKDIDLYSAGFAVGGTAGVSGTANVLVSEDSVAASAESGTNITAGGSLNVEGNSDYELVSATGVLAGGTAGVGVNAVVSVLKSSTTAEVGGKVNAAGNVDVKAVSLRDVTNAAANLSVGMAGVGVNVMVLVAGTKMSQDSADMLTYGNAGSKDGSAKTFDSAQFLGTQGLAGSYREYEKDDKGNYVLDKDGNRKVKTGTTVTASQLSGDLEGNGHYESKESVGATSGSGSKKQGTFDASSGYRSADFDNDSFNDNGGTQRGENLQASDTKDVADAKKINTYTYETPSDAVIARITETAEIEKAGNVSVSAAQPVKADLLGVTAAGGMVGVGVTAAVAILHSNVLASSLGTIKEATGAVSVTAESAAGGTVSDQSAAMKEILEDLDPERGGIRAVGLGAGAGAVGVAVGVSVVLTDNITQATLGGRIDSAADVTVSANQDYGHITSAVGMAAGAAVAVDASVAVAQSNGTVAAAVADGAKVHISGDLKVTTTGNQHVTALAATAGAGAIAVNAGVALAINRLTQRTGIGSRTASGPAKEVGENPDISAKNIIIQADSDTSADSGLLGISLGVAGVALGAAVSQVNPELDTYAAGVTLKAEETMEVFNNVTSSAAPKVISFAGGGLAAGGNVLLAFNETVSKARVSSAGVNAAKLNVVADLSGTADSVLEAASVGGIAVGVSVNYADMQADNRAVLENTRADVGDLLVATGRGEHTATTARADSITGGMGFASVSLNAAVARNSTKSYAVVNGGTITSEKDVVVRSNDTVTAKASTEGLSASGLLIAANTVVALNDADTRVSVKADSLTATAGKASFETVHRAESGTKIITGGGAHFEGRASIGVAYGRSAGIVDVDVKKLAAGAGLTAKNDASGTTKTEITNGTYAAVKATAMLGMAYDQSLYDTKVTLGDGSSVTGDIDVITEYGTGAKADVTPHKGGLDVSLLKLTVNLAAAKNTAYAGADLTVNNGTVKATGGINVQAAGTGTANAVINPVKVEVSGVKVAANFAYADMSRTQAATVHLNDAALEADGDVNIQALSRKAEAAASLGNAGASAAVSISLANITASHAWARENMSSTAGVIGNEKIVQTTELFYDITHWRYGNIGQIPAAEAIAAGYLKNYDSYECNPVEVVTGETKANGNTLKAAAVNIGATADKNEYSMEQTDGDGTRMVTYRVGSMALATTNGAKNVSFLTLGNLEANATASDSFSAILQGVHVTAAGDVAVTARTDSAAGGTGAAPGGYSLINGGISNAYGNIGTESSRQTAQTLIGDGTAVHGRNVRILAENNATAVAAFAKKGGYSLAKLDSSSQPTASWLSTSLLVGSSADIQATGALTLQAQSNPNARSEVYNSATGLVLNVATMKGSNELHEDTVLSIDKDTKLTSGSDMLIRTGSKVNMSAKSQYDGSFSLIGSNQAEAYNRYWRGMTLAIADGVNAESGGKLDIIGDMGTEDLVETHAKEKVRAALEFAKALAKADAWARNTVNVNAATLTAAKDLNIIGMTGGTIKASGDVDAAETFKVDAAPTGTSVIGIDVANEVNINRGHYAHLDPAAVLTSREGGIYIKSKLEKMNAVASNFVEGSGLLGGVDAIDQIGFDIRVNLWMDIARFQEKNGTHLRANLGEDSLARFEAHADAALYGVGTEGSSVRIGGTARAQIQTNVPKAATGYSRFTHIANASLSAVRITDCTGWDIAIGIRKDGTSYALYELCDYCLEYKENDRTDYYDWDLGAKWLEKGFSKALAPVSEISRRVGRLDPVTKERYGEEEERAAGKLYVLDVEVLLNRDVTFGEERLGKYLLWTDALTQSRVYLLPNADRLYRRLGLDYVTEVIRGDVRGDGGVYDIDIYTALTQNAIRNPLIPIGSTGSLDFATGVLTLPSLADFELYLHEVSGAWLLEQVRDGSIRRLDADPDRINAYMLNGGTLPAGTIVAELTESGEAEGWQLYWLGDTPETAKDPGQTLIGLLWDPETDEIDAFRTSGGMAEAGENPVDVSLCIYRDSRSDRRSEEKYNVMFFDTPAGEKSLVKVITDGLEGRELEMPRPFRIVLRGRDIGGADLPVYSLSDHFFAMNDGTDGEVSMFGGFYTAAFDGDVFESDYIRIEGILDNDLQITVKEGQPVWPEWTGEDAAEDIQENRYLRTENEWTDENGEPAGIPAEEPETIPGAAA